MRWVRPALTTPANWCDFSRSDLGQVGQGGYEGSVDISQWRPRGWPRGTCRWRTGTRLRGHWGGPPAQGARWPGWPGPRSCSYWTRSPSRSGKHPPGTGRPICPSATSWAASAMAPATSALITPRPAFSRAAALLSSARPRTNARFDALAGHREVVDGTLGLGLPLGRAQAPAPRPSSRARPGSRGQRRRGRCGRRGRRRSSAANYPLPAAVVVGPAAGRPGRSPPTQNRSLLGPGAQ
jgi:hypothetical protein